ncbi:probable extracytoplasmic function alternative sigma factor [Lentisphaera araneosa HTCC2155]|jgi:RNA polymerase sigma factor (sigma-70 family)|uniref:RNA polymerase sigma factor SigS n=1 Tax=Lentisphaera araneosa HTCC2155 TaxID=313628 RepID=A6DKN3_9BACT|nr:RNA polymerase sigma factor [Lentisphaera araneosa]EDM27931.1 probable extracytoplasmic function alternative sigma factor [Lentisphaera araneosa HTCC2155]
MDKYNTRQTLIAKIREQHNEQSWEEFTDLYKAYLYSIMIRMGVQESDRDDLVQKSLIEIWKSLPRFEYVPGQGKFRNWIYTVTKHQCLGHFRTNKRYQNKIQKASEQGALEGESESKSEDIEEAEWKKHIFTLAWERIEPDLSDSYRQVFMLFSEGKNVEEISGELELQKNSVHVYRQRVLKRLNREIRFLDDELG